MDKWEALPDDEKRSSLRQMCGSILADPKIRERLYVDMSVLREYGLNVGQMDRIAAIGIY